MAASLKHACERARALAEQVCKARGDALGSDAADAVLAPLSRVRDENALRLLLMQLQRRLTEGGVLTQEALRSDWLLRCTESKDTPFELCEELDEAICWDTGAAWRNPPPADVSIADVIVLDADDAPVADADERAVIIHSLQARVTQLEKENKRLEALEAENELLRVELERLRLPQQRARPQAVPEAIDLCTDSDEDDDDDVVDVTPPSCGVKRPPSIKLEAVEARPASPADSGAGPSTLAPRSVLKREAAPCALPPPKLRRAVPVAAPLNVASGRGSLGALLGALLRRSGQLLQAHHCKAKLHLLGEKSGVSCLHAAAFNDANAAVLALILAHAAADGPDALQYALRRQSGAGTAKSGVARRSAHLVLGAGATALDFACVHGAVECATLLLQAGADPDARTARLHGSPEGRLCALDLAASAGHLGIIRVLLRARADVNARNEFGWTPLHWAAEHAQVDVVRLLLLSGADPDAADREGRTAVVWAMASDNGKPIDENEAIKYDCHDDRVAVMVELAYAGARKGFPARADEPIAIGEYGRTLLHACAGGLSASSLVLLRRLLSAPVSPPLNLDVGTGELGTPLDLAIHAGWPEGALLLLNKGASVDAAEKTDFTPLMRAAVLPAGMGGSDLIRLCCLKNAQTELRDEDGRTAAHWAAMHGRVDALRTLRAMGADVHARDHAGLTPAMLAERHNSDRALRAAIAAVINAPTCPPRTYKPGEDVACDQEEVAIEVNAAKLSDDTCFIAHNVEAFGVTLNKPRESMTASRACCDCILCIPGTCPCLSTSAVVDVAAELKRVDEELAGEVSHVLSMGDADEGGSFIWRAVGTGLRSVGTDPLSTFATGAHLATHARARAPAGLPAVGLAVALLALRRLLPLIDENSGLDAGWESRVRSAPKKRASFIDELSTLLLELDDAAAAVVRVDAQSRTVPVWRVKQAAAWLAEARPVWRASARQGRHGAPLTPAALAEAMNGLLVSLTSVHVPLLVKPKVSSNGIATLGLCSTSCLCAAGGCRATGVQYPLELRDMGESIGLGVFAKTRIPRGALVAPYVGEVTSAAKADAEARESQSGHFYQLDLEAEAWERLRTPLGGVAVIDGSHFSNTTRFFNHMCEPNLGRAAVDWPGLEAGPLVFLYALEDIEPDTEMCWSYFSGDRREMGFKCSCPKCDPSKVVLAPRARGKQPMRC